MRHWSQLATRNWRARPVRTAAVIVAIALGASAVVWVTCCFESVRRAVMAWAVQYVGTAQVTVESPLGKYDTIPQRLVSAIQSMPQVENLTARLVQRLRGLPISKAEFESKPDLRLHWTDEMPEVDFLGLDVPREYEIRKYELHAGRLIEPGDEYVCVLESSWAEELKLGVGDYVLIWGGAQPDDQPIALKIVGLMERRRVARFQKAQALLPLKILQTINLKQGMVTTIDVVVRDKSEAGVSGALNAIRAEARKKVANASVRSVKARMQQIETAQSQQEFVLFLLSCVAMLTALFIILSTLSMGMIERIAQLGLMRCVGMTRAQLGALVLVEVLPLGIAGVLLGIPIGLGLTALTVYFVPEYVGSFPVRWTEITEAASGGIVSLARMLLDACQRTGILAATVAGITTTLVAALLPTIAAARVSPLDAARPLARQHRPGLLVLVAGLAAFALVLQHIAVVGLPDVWKDGLREPLQALYHSTGIWLPIDGVRRSPGFIWNATAGVVLLYVGYALLAPVLVWGIGMPAVVVAARLLNIRTRLLQDQVGHAVWRSAGICCGLMVGLSLIVGLFVFSESITGGWQFPKQFPEAYVWSYEQMTPEARERIERIDGIREFTTANAVNVFVDEKPLFMQQVYLSVTWFLGVEPDSFMDLLKLEFIEGDAESALRLLKQGSHVVVAEDFAKSRNKKLGDSVRVIIGSKQHMFKIAGIVQSPALDIAAGYFQAQSEAQVVAVGSVMGTQEDLNRYFGIRATKMVLLNFDLPPTPVPENWPPTRGTFEAAGIPFECFDSNLPLDRRWQRYREDRVLQRITEALEAPRAFSGTARELKDEIDRELTRMTRLLTAVPAVALLVAIVGVANLMTANVTSRARQIAILRAVGATRGLILRMVIGEAVVLGLIGSALGLGLGVHLAGNTTLMTSRMWGFEASLSLPWSLIAAACVITIALCALAGTLPARHASRSNIVDALRVG